MEKLLGEGIISSSANDLCIAPSTSMLDCIRSVNTTGS
jgi:hypothetical protein